jgi:hypothetical protein
MGILLACEKKISSSALGLSMMTLHECHVDRPFRHVTRCWVRTGPPAVWAWNAYLNPAFGLNPQILNAVAWTCDKHVWFSFTHIYTDFIISFCNYNPWSLE